MAYPSYTDTNLNPLVLNYVPDPETFDQMTTDNQINDNEVYLVQEEEEKEIFYATYNETTYEEVVEAYENGKDIIVIDHYDDNEEIRCSLIDIYQIPNKSSSYIFSWMSYADGFFEFVFLDSDHGWGSQEKNYLSYVYTDNIENQAVTTDKIATSAVTTDKIPNKAITIDKIADKSKLIWYGYCDTASDEDTKIVSIPDITELTIGLTLQVRFQYPHINGTGNTQLKLNNFNSYPILIRGNANGGDPIAYGSNNYEWVTNEILTLVYVGRGWVIVDGAHATTMSYGKTKLNSAINSTSTSEAATPSAVKQAYDLANSKAPISHASSATTYGVGTGSNYGHLKLSDSTTSTSGTSEGIAATPAAVKAAYDLANSKVSKSGDTMTGYLAFNGSNGITFNFNDNSATTIKTNGYDGDSTNNIPRLRFISKKANTSGSSDYNVILQGIANPKSDYEAANKQYVDNTISSAIGNVNSFEYEVVSTLPTTGIKDHTIYLVAKTGETNDVYDEYMYINNNWERIGSTEMDLSGYVPTIRKVNNKALSSDITLNASDVGALPDDTVIPAQIAKIWTGTCSTASATNAKVVTLDDSTGFSLTDGVKIAILFKSFYTGSPTDTTLNINNTGAKQVVLSNTASAGSYNSGNNLSWGNYDIVLFSYQAIWDEWVFCGSYVLQQKAYNLASNAVPKTTTINNKALSSNITLTASDVSALPSNTTYVSSVNGNSGVVTVTDEKVKATPLNGTNSGKGLLFSSNNGSTETTNSVYTSNKLMWNDYDQRLYFYNSDRNKYGALSYSSLRLAQSSSSYYGSLSLNKLTANQTYNLPNATGTIALTNDIVDEKLKTTLLDSENMQYVILGNATTTADTKVYSDSFKFQQATNSANLTLGKQNSTNGTLQLWRGNYITYLQASSTSTSNFYIELPNQAGTLALTSDIDHKWNDVALSRTLGTDTSDLLIPYLNSIAGKEAKLVSAADGVVANAIARRTSNGYLRANTPAEGNNSNYVATTAFVSTAISTKAPLASPAFSGTPTAPTAAVGTNNTQIATTAFVQAAINAAITAALGASY